VDDSEYLDRFALGQLDDLPHEGHLKAVYLQTRRSGAESAVDFARAGLRQATRRAGVPEKYHDTITVAWARIVADHARRDPRDGFESFLEAHPQLRRRDLLDAHYTRERLSSDEGRVRFIEPDLLPLP
jgi:hypothetical protein